MPTFAGDRDDPDQDERGGRCVNRTENQADFYFGERDHYRPERAE